MILLPLKIAIRVMAIATVVVVAAYSFLGRSPLVRGGGPSNGRVEPLPTPWPENDDDYLACPRDCSPRHRAVEPAAGMPAEFRCHSTLKWRSV